VNDYWEVLPDGNLSLLRLPVRDSDAGYVDVTDFKREGEKQNRLSRFRVGYGAMKGCRISWTSSD